MCVRVYACAGAHTHARGRARPNNYSHENAGARVYGGGLEPQQAHS